MKKIITTLALTLAISVPTFADGHTPVMGVTGIRLIWDLPVTRQRWDVTASHLIRATLAAKAAFGIQNRRFAAFRGRNAP